MRPVRLGARTALIWLGIQAASLRSLQAAETSEGLPAVSLVALNGCQASLVVGVTADLRVELLARLVQSPPPEDAYRATIACSGDVVTLSVSADSRERSRTADLAQVPVNVRSRVAALALAELVRDLDLDRDTPTPTVAAPPLPMKLSPSPPPSSMTAATRKSDVEIGAFAAASDFAQHDVTLPGAGLRFGYSRAWLYAGFDVAIMSDTERFAPGTVRVILTYGSPYVAWQQTWRAAAARLGAGYALGAARLTGLATAPLTPRGSISGPWASPYLLAEFELHITEGLRLQARGQLGWVTAPVIGQVAGTGELSLAGFCTGAQLGLALAFE